MELNLETKQPNTTTQRNMMYIEKSLDQAPISNFQLNINY